MIAQRKYDSVGLDFDSDGIDHAQYGHRHAAILQTPRPKDICGAAETLSDRSAVSGFLLL
jgi:hypothetical protein